MEEKKIAPGIHKMSIHNRKDALLTGVADVISFDTEEILMETTQGMLTIKGKELHVKRLTLEKGEVELDGTIDSFTYSDADAYARKGESFLKRLFK
ncbi:MAG: sporulation protein YabP [Lachnospiraceae bacterium]|nr:sporulation protein YabP [Lachnospiraceae bacterium]